MIPTPRTRLIVLMTLFTASVLLVLGKFISGSSSISIAGSLLLPMLYVWLGFHLVNEVRKTQQGRVKDVNELKFDKYHAQVVGLASVGLLLAPVSIFVLPHVFGVSNEIATIIGFVLVSIIIVFSVLYVVQIRRNS